MGSLPCIKFRLDKSIGMPFEAYVSVAYSVAYLTRSCEILI